VDVKRERGPVQEHLHRQHVAVQRRRSVQCDLTLAVVRNCQRW
jgi:hypothetical protein